jgi:hypothetical protein
MFIDYTHLSLLARVEQPEFHPLSNIYPLKTTLYVSGITSQDLKTLRCFHLESNELDSLELCNSAHIIHNHKDE